MKTIHTHRGHCQLCASVQAIDVSTGIIAKHGYTVDGGYFSGTCPGSDVMNLHVSRALADSEIATARAKASHCRMIADQYSKRQSYPVHVWGGEYRMARGKWRGGEADFMGYGENRRQFCPLEKEEIKVLWADATEEFQEKGRTRAILSLIGTAEQCEGYAKNLEFWANRITGKVDPYQKKDLEPRDWQKGDTVQIGGKKGFSAVIEEVEMQDYTTFGFRRGRGTVKTLHGRVTRPAITEKRVSEKAGGYVTREAQPAKVFWVALRDIKRAPNPLAEELKKAGLL